MQEQNTIQAPILPPRSAVQTSQRPLSDLVARQAKLPPRSRLNTPKKTAEIYGVSLRALKRAWADRRLNYYKIGHRSILLDVRDVEDFLSRCRVDALRT